MTEETRPLAVRVLRVTGWVATIVGAVVAITALGIGGAQGFEDLAAAWAGIAAIGILLLLAGVTALLAGRRSLVGLMFGLVSCAFLLLLLPIGTAITVAVAIIASQSWPQLRDYYGITRRTA